MATIEKIGVLTSIDDNGNTIEMYPEVKADATLSVSGKAADAAAVGEALGNKIDNDYASNSGCGKGIKFPRSADGTIFTFRPWLPNNLIQITKNDASNLLSVDTSGNTDIYGGLTVTDGIVSRKKGSALFVSSFDSSTGTLNTVS